MCLERSLRRFDGFPCFFSLFVFFSFFVVFFFCSFSFLLSLLFLFILLDSQHLVLWICKFSTYVISSFC